MIETKAFYDALLARQMDFFAGVPDSLLQNLCACIQGNSPKERNIIAANEGNAVGIAAGYHVATGRYGVVYMQNSGQGNTVNPLLSLADEDVYRVPMLLIIGWRGEPGVHDEPQHVKQGKVTLGLLDAMGIAYRVLDDDYEGHLNACHEYLKTEGKPIALIVRKDAFTPCKAPKAAARFTMSREQALEHILSAVGEEALVVSTTGKTSREIFEIRERRGQDHKHDFLTVGSMGHTASIALGFSLGTDRPVWCVDGDGSFLMHMGGMAVAASVAGPNYHYVLINNGAHESVGGQPTVALDIDVAGVLKAVGFRMVIGVRTPEELEAGLQRVAGEPLAALVIYVNQGSRPELGRPTIAPEQNKRDMMALLGSR